MNINNLTGYYNMQGFQLQIQEIDGQLAGSIPHVPPGYEILLEPVSTMDGSNPQYRMKGGPMDGSSVEFVLDETGIARALRTGMFELSRVAPQDVANIPAIRRLAAPDLELFPEKQSAFESLLAAILANPRGETIQYDLPYPKAEFVQYLMQKDQFIFHGSNNLEIDVFKPVRSSYELYDRNGTGNSQAVYGTHDGLWAMFFAIVDRGRLRGSIRNGVMYVHNREGKALAVYNFSINKEQLPEKPWTEGMLYLLPRSAFTRQRLSEHSYSNEWICPEEVKPHARLALLPQDFPFLDQIEGHDDGFMLRAQTLSNAVRSAALTAVLDGERFIITLPASSEIRQTLTDWLEIQKMMIPMARSQVHDTEGQIVLTVEDLPPAYKQVFHQQYRELLER